MSQLNDDDRYCPEWVDSEKIDWDYFLELIEQNAPTILTKDPGSVDAVASAIVEAAREVTSG